VQNRMGRRRDRAEVKSMAVAAPTGPEADFHMN
jgi:hypothetical protein